MLMTEENKISVRGVFEPTSTGGGGDTLRVGNLQKVSFPAKLGKKIENFVPAVQMTISSSIPICEGDRKVNSK